MTRADIWDSADYLVRLLTVATCIALLFCRWLGVAVSSPALEAAVLVACGWVLCSLVLRVDERVTAWADRHGLFDEDEGEDE